MRSRQPLLATMLSLVALAAAGACARGADEPAPKRAASPPASGTSGASGSSGAAGQPAPAAAGPIALVNGRIYTAPDQPPIDGGTIVIDNGRITALGRTADITPPAAATLVDAAGQTITAGFWNSHVHFMRRIWEVSATAPAETLSSQMDTMLTRHGFTSVMDTGSYLDVTKALRDRVEKGEVRGPFILTAGEILFPKGGMMTEAPPWAIQRPMLEAASPEEAARLTTEKMAQGADALKLYMATWYQPRVQMSAPVAMAAAKASHAAHKLVLAHPTNRLGIDTALDAGVDIIVHTAPEAGVWDKKLLDRLIKQKVSIIPTLKLWREELSRNGPPAPAALKAFQGAGVAQLRAFAQAGGDILFGTDIGYLEDDDIREEIVQMGNAGLTARQILASLTTSPSSRFGRPETGRLTVGGPADIVLLAGNPEEDLLAFTRVQRVLRNGKTIWTASVATTSK